MPRLAPAPESAPAPPDTSTNGWVFPRSDRLFYEIVPYDKLTGISYPIAPYDEALDPADPDTSWHHEHNPHDYLIGLGEIGRGIRAGRLQLSLNRDHNEGIDTFHTMTGRTHTPGSRIGRVRLTLFDYVGAVPDQVFDVRAAELRQITEEERQRLFYGGLLKVESRAVVSRPITRFVIDTGIDHLRRQEIRDYRGSDSESRQAVVDGILGRLLEKSFDLIDDRYKEAKARGFLPEDAPPTPAEAARQLIFDTNENFRFEVFEEAFRLMESREAA